MAPNKDLILEALSSVLEPDLKKNIVELGLVSNILISDQHISFTVKVHNPALHNRKKMEEACAIEIATRKTTIHEFEITRISLPEIGVDN